MSAEEFPTISSMGSGSSTNFCRFSFQYARLKLKRNDCGLCLARLQAYALKALQLLRGRSTFEPRCFT